MGGIVFVIYGAFPLRKCIVIVTTINWIRHIYMKMQIQIYQGNVIVNLKNVVYPNAYSLEKKGWGLLHLCRDLYAVDEKQ